MAEKPIIFTGDSIPAILDGRKTQTRRVIKPQPEKAKCGSTPWSWQRKKNSSVIAATEKELAFKLATFFPPYQVGDILWVKENWMQAGAWHRETDKKGNVLKKWWAGGDLVLYSADKPIRPPLDACLIWRPRPSIHMPQWASRIKLEVTNVRAERLQDVTEEDAKAEGASREIAPWRAEYAFDIGMTMECRSNYRDGFQRLWDSLNAKRGYGWETNPWVWVYTFKKIEIVEVGLYVSPVTPVTSLGDKSAAKD